MIHRLLLPLFSAGLLAQAPTAPSPKLPQPPVVSPDVKTITPVPPKPPADSRPHCAPRPTPARAEPSAAPIASIVPPLPADLLVFDTTANGHQFAAANGWKAEFAPEGFTFLPFLGSDATEPAALHIAPAQVRLGGVDLMPRPATPIRTDRRIELDRGIYVERFDVTPGGVEQSCVFASLPTRDALVLDLAVTTALRGEPTSRGLRFVGARGGVTVTDAVAIDADGRRCELPIERTAAGLRLTVPAQFVAEAALPLVVDPTYAPQLFWTTTVADGHPDIAFLPPLGEYLVVWQREFSATDRDVWALRFTAGMQGNASFFAFDLTSESWELPRIAACALAQNYMVVAQASLGGTSPFWIAGRTWSHTVGLGSPFVVEAAGLPGHAGGDKLRPDIGGDPSLAGPVYYTVVWERAWTPTDHDVHAKQVTPAGVLRSASPLLLDNGGTNETHPRIAKSNGPGISFLTQYWPIVWQRTYSPSDEDIYGCHLSWDGQITVPVRALTLSADDERDPSPSSPTLQFNGVRQNLVAWSRFDLIYDQEVVVSLYNHTGGLVTADWLGNAEGNGPERARPQVRPAVDCDGSRFAVAYSEFDAAGSRWDTRLSLCAYAAPSNAMIVQDSRVLLGSSSGDEDHVSIVAQGAAGGQPTVYGAVYDLDDLAGTWGIVAQAYDGYASLPLPTSRPTGCGGLDITLAELPSLGAALHFTQTGSGVLTGFVFGFPQSLSLATCPGCTVGVNGYSVPNPFTFTVPMAPAFVGLLLSCQAWSLGGGSCLGSVALSDTIDLQIL